MSSTRSSSMVLYTRLRSMKSATRRGVEVYREVSSTAHPYTSLSRARGTDLAPRRRRDSDTSHTARRCFGGPKRVVGRVVPMAWWTLLTPTVHETGHLDLSTGLLDQARIGQIGQINAYGP